MKSLFLSAAVLLSLGAVSARADYRQKAEEATDYIQSHFYDAKAQRYHPIYPRDLNGLEFDVMWANGVQLAVLAAAAHQDPAKYKPVLYAFTNGLQTYWDPQPKGTPPGYNAYCSGPGGTDKYYDDNEWIALDYTEAYRNTHDPKFLTLARDTQTFVLSGWDDALGGGIYWKIDHKSKNTCSNGPAAATALRLTQATGDKEQLVWAQKICDWTSSKLEDTDGLYWDNVNLNGDIQRWKFSYNTALMIYADTLLFQLGHDKAALAAARRSADAGLAAWTDPANGSLQKTEHSTRFTVWFCDALLRLYDATHDVQYLNAVRRQAAYGYRAARDPQGGYWSDWTAKTHSPDEKKDMIENAAVARLFWLLAPYPDGDALYAKGMAAAGKGRYAQAENLLQQAADSDAQAVEARFRLWRVLTREKKTAAAMAQSDRLTALAADPALAARLKAVGWTQP